MRRAALLLAVLAAGVPVHAQAPLWGDAPATPLDLRGELSATEVPLLGDLALRLDLFVADGTEVAFAPSVPPDFIGAVEEQAPRQVAGGVWRRYDLALRPSKTGEMVIPPFEARAGEDGPAATTPEWTVTVTSLLAEADEAIEAPAPPFPARPALWPWLAGGAGALALLALWLWWRRRAPLQRQATETPVPAHVRALRALGRLRNAPRGTAREIEAFYVEVSYILRVYLEERFGMHAPERTTEEFLVEVESDARLGGEQRLRLREFLAQCDLVKFARALPAEQVHARTFDTAEQLIEATRADRVREGAA